MWKDRQSTTSDWKYSQIELIVMCSSAEKGCKIYL